jgi:hypothetical protein
MLSNGFFVKRIKGLANWPLVRDICMQISQQTGGKHSLEALYYGVIRQ